MLDFFIRYFLVFPKILIHEHWGILIGEIILILYWPYYILSRKKVVFNDILATYYSFVIYFVFGSSLITAINFNFFPTHSLLYLFRLVLCFGLFLWAYDSYSKYESDKDIVTRIFNKPFVIHFFISLVIVVAYYITHSPTTNDILWDYKVGLRMIPLAGLVIDFDSFFFLKAVSGSGNLLSGWALAILIVNFNLGKNNFSKSILPIAVLTVLLTVSRGGFLTISIYLIYAFLKKFNSRVSARVVLVVVAFVALLVIYFSFSSKTPLPNIFERLTNTYDGGGFDGSTQGRFDNYIALFNAWVQNWYYVIFGFGFDEDALLITSNQTVVESYFLEVIFCSGLIGLGLLILFYLSVFVSNQKDFWYKCLWEFLVFQSIIAWTVTGGDFLAPHATFIFLTFIGFGTASYGIKKRMQV